MFNFPNLGFGSVSSSTGNEENANSNLGPIQTNGTFSNTNATNSYTNSNGNHSSGSPKGLSPLGGIPQIGSVGIPQPQGSNPGFSPARNLAALNSNSGGLNATIGGNSSTNFSLSQSGFAHNHLGNMTITHSTPLSSFGSRAAGDANRSSLLSVLGSGMSSNSGGHNSNNDDHRDGGANDSKPTYGAAANSSTLSSGSFSGGGIGSGIGSFGGASSLPSTAYSGMKFDYSIGPTLLQNNNDHSILGGRNHTSDPLSGRKDMSVSEKLSSNGFGGNNGSGINDDHGLGGSSSYGGAIGPAATAPSITTLVNNSMRQSSTSYENTLIVFDWDDTFFPTSALERNRLLRIPCQKLRPQIVQQLNTLSQACIEILNNAERYGKVVIITNSAPGWIDTSCQAFMPMLHPKIRSYSIFAKPMSYLLTFKLDVFKREVGTRYTNLVSIGDGIAERTATLRLAGTQPPNTTRHCKSVKFKDLPTMAQLLEQLELLHSRFDHICHYQGDLDLRANFGPLSNRLTAPLVGPKRGGCSFVHLSHLGQKPNLEEMEGLLYGHPPQVQATTSTLPKIYTNTTTSDDTAEGKTAAIRRASIGSVGGSVIDKNRVPTVANRPSSQMVRPFGLRGKS